MRILVMTNTYLPFVGGVERSVETFVEEYRRLGHRVVIVTPKCHHTPEYEYDVVRIPAVQNFNGTDFSVQRKRLSNWCAQGFFFREIVGIGSAAVGPVTRGRRSVDAAEKSLDC